MGEKDYTVQEQTAWYAEYVEELQNILISIRRSYVLD